MEQLKNSKRKYYLIYTGLFLLFASLLIGYLALNGKTNINKASDGMNQHYRAMVYYSRYLKEIAANLINSHKLVLPTWDFTIGEGADIINVLHSDAIGDPLTFLCFFVPERYMHIYYMFNAFIRVYLAGIFFSELCFYLNKKNEYSYCAIMAGTISYIFCFWSLSSLTHHIYFLTPLMYLPLMILGLEKIINGEGPYLFVVAVFLGAISWLYFFYMEAAVTAIYGIVRLVCLYGKDIKTITSKLFMIAVSTILGIGLSFVILLPMISAYMGDSRMELNNAVSILYPSFFYERLLTIFVSNDSAYDLCMGFVSPALLTLILSLKDSRKNKTLAAINVITFLCVCLPFCGKALNGFSFVSQRWSFAIALPVAFSLTYEWDHITDNKRLLAAVIVCVAALSMLSAWSRNERVFVPVAICVAFFLIAILPFKKEKLKQCLLISLLLINVAYIESYNLSRRGGDVINDLLDIEKARNLTNSSEAYTMQKFLEGRDENMFYRYTGNALTNNAAMMFGGNSTKSYWSITNSSDQEFRMLLGMQDYISWQINGYDNRAQLETLANVKYYICNESYEGSIPYGFDKIGGMDGYGIYENKYVVPFGYTYHDVVSYDDFQNMNMLERQNVMMHAVVLENHATSVHIDAEHDEIAYEITCSEGISIEENTIVVNDRDAYITMHCVGKLPFNYIMIDGVDFLDTNNVVEDDHTESIIAIDIPDSQSLYLGYLTKDHHYYFGKSDYLVYLGNEGITEIKLSFSLVGTYKFDKILLANVCMDDYEEETYNLSKYCLDNVGFTSNTVTGSIDLEDDGYVVLSIPYSKGWKAYVDGEQVETLKANIHYIGLELESGHHEIELKYATPGLSVGALASFVSLLALASYAIYKRKFKA